MIADLSYCTHVSHTAVGAPGYAETNMCMLVRQSSAHTTISTDANLKCTLHQHLSSMGRGEHKHEFEFRHRIAIVGKDRVPHDALIDGAVASLDNLRLLHYLPRLLGPRGSC